MWSPALSGTLIEQEYLDLAERLVRTHRSANAFDKKLYDPTSVARVRTLWSARMLNEYTSTTVFSQLAAQLVEANATLDTTAVTLRMAQDELRHAHVCADVVRALGGATAKERDATVVTIAQHPGCSPEERALRNVIFTTCVSEMNSIAYFVAALDMMKDPYLRDVTRELLADEVLHGRFGFAYLEAWAPWLREHPEVCVSIARYLRFAFSVAEHEFTKGEGAPARTYVDGDALGIVSAELSAETFRNTMRYAVVPGLERFGIPAEQAWSKRVKHL